MSEQSEQTDRWRQRALGRDDLASGTARLGERPLGSADDRVRRVYQRTDATDAKGATWELTKRAARRTITCDASISAESFVAEQVDGAEVTTLYVTSPQFDVGDRVFVEPETLSECQANYEAIRTRPASK